MRRWFNVRWLVVVSLLAVWGCQPPATAEPDRLVVGSPVRYANLTIFPITSTSPKEDDRFITLDEGLKSGKVVIREIGGARPNAPADPFDGPPSGPPTNSLSSPTDSDQDSATGPDVNKLMVLNTSDKPLYLMPGEILMGGQQDRAVGQEIVIQPGKKSVPVEVFCVEHGRWHGRDVAETTQALVTASRGQAPTIGGFVSESTTGSEDQVVFMRAAKEANSGKFVASLGNASAKVRFALEDTKDQGEAQRKVWDEVSKANASSGVASESDNFNSNYFDADNVRRLEAYMENLQKPVADTRRVVGVIVAVNGNVRQLDVFGSSPLFKKLWPKLLKGYALDAATAAAEETADRFAKRTDANLFCHRALSGEARRDERHDADKTGLTRVRRETLGCVSFTCHDPQSPFVTSVIPVVNGHGRRASFSAGFSGGGFGGVHSSAFAK